MNRVTILFGATYSVDKSHLQINLTAKQSTSCDSERVDHKLELFMPPRRAYPVSAIDRQAVQHFITDNVPPASSVVMIAGADSIDQVAMPFVAAAIHQMQCRCQAIMLQATLPQLSSGLAALRQTLTIGFLRAIHCPVALTAVDATR